MTLDVATVLPLMCLTFTMKRAIVSTTAFCSYLFERPFFYIFDTRAAREALSRMMLEMQNTMNAIGDYSDTEDEDSDNEPTKTPTLKPTIESTPVIFSPFFLRAF